MSRLPAENRALLREVNGLLMDRARSLLSRQMTGTRFRAMFRAEEGVELSGLSEFDIQDPIDRLELSRLTVPWAQLPLAILNHQLHARQYEPTADFEFVLVLDLGRSAAYPLSRFYAGEDVGPSPVTPGTYAASKPGLIKLVAGAFLSAAVDSGFLARVVVIDGPTIRVGPQLRRPDLVPELFEPIDRYLCERVRRPPAETPYGRVALEMVQRKGCFLFVGDFLGGAVAWPDPDARRRWLRALELFRDWASRRPVVVARVNHWREVQPPDSLEQRLLVRHDFRDTPTGPPGQFQGTNKDGEEDRRYTRDRLRAQAEWAAVFPHVLRPACRGFLSVHSNTGAAGVARELRRMWSGLVG